MARVRRDGPHGRDLVPERDTDCLANLLAATVIPERGRLTRLHQFFRVETSITSCGAASFWPAELTWM